ncbi:MAG: flagellar basal body-associated FliL family protein [Roseicyclus sp.]|nr:flagellar basal body-associated FliL family protein [Roseicyclus sp.]
MMRLLLPVILLLVGVGGGVGAGLMLAGGTEETAADEGEEGGSAEEEEPAEETDADDGPAEQESANPTRVEQTGTGTEYVRINNQFIVPIVRNGSVRSLVVMGLSVEVDTGQSGAVFTLEPRLRDSFLRVMFAHANAGGFDGRFTEADAMAPLREALREAAQGILGRDTTHDVLITDIIRQDA